MGCPVCARFFLVLFLSTSYHRSPTAPSHRFLTHDEKVNMIYSKATSANRNYLDALPRDFFESWSAQMTIVCGEVKGAVRRNGGEKEYTATRRVCEKRRW